MFAMFRRQRQQALQPEFVRDAHRALSGVPDRCPIYMATQQTETLMVRSTYMVAEATRNENAATREAAVYFMVGACLAYCAHHGVTEAEDLRSIVRDAMRCWNITAAAADHLADNLGDYLADERFAAKVIDHAGDAVLASPGEDVESVTRVVATFAKALSEWRDFEVHAHVN